MIFLVFLCGCGFEPFVNPDETNKNQISIVLTFDDGPLTADVAEPQEATDHEALLAPLDRILAGLEQNGATAVFYIKGPGTPEVGEAVKDIFGRGISSIYRAKQIMGYHAYNHRSPIWEFPQNMLFWTRGPMEEDLRQLRSFISEMGESEGLTGDDLLTPIFRQPFGGQLVGTSNGSMVARKLGLTYHAYMIDSFDWTGHPDADPEMVANLPVGTEEDHSAFVRARLREKAKNLSTAPVVDVLLHVNSFTADHLQEWIDELRGDFEELSGKTVVFEVPEAYLIDSQTQEDISVLSFLF